ncbi:MAG: glycosyltransferase [Marinoscillum sp.]
MKKGKDIVCISMTTWEGDYMKTIVHMVSQLAKNHQVLFVDYPFTAKDVMGTIAGKANAPVKRMLGLSPRLRTLSEKGQEIYHLTLPPVLPINWINNPTTYSKLNTLQSSIIASSILQAMDTLAFDKPIVINAFNPIVGLPLVGKLNESKLVYYCYDEIRAAQWCGKHGGMMEDQFMQKVNEVIVTSEGLYASKSKVHPNTTLVKNGVDFDLFHKGFNRTKDTPRKVVGYVGSIDFRLDYDLLEHLIRAKKKYDFHFVGRVTEPEQQQRLAKYPNVNFFGPQQPNDIPKKMAQFDIGIIPFAKNEFTKNIYPLKINEYLAVGIPVVSTDFASLDDFKEVVAISKSNLEFQAHLDAELVFDTTDKALERVRIAQQNDWSERALEVEKVLDKQLLSHA